MKAASVDRWRFGAPLLCTAIAAVTGCGCCGEKREVVAVVESPVRVEWVHERKWSIERSSVSLLKDRNVILVNTQIQIEAHVDCHEPDPRLVLDAAGERLAFRCANGTPWSLLHLGSGGRGFHAPNPNLGQGGEPDWSSAPGFEQTALDIIGEGYAGSELLEEAAARGGALATRIFLASLDRTSGGPIKGWSDAYSKLPAESRKAVDAGLRARILDPAISASALLAAASSPNEDDEQVAAALLARAEEHFDREKASGDNNLSTTKAAVFQVVLRTSLTHPQKAGALACRAFEAWAVAAHDTSLVIAHTRTACEAVRKEGEDGVEICNALQNCDSGEGFRLCDEREAMDRVREELEATRREPGKKREISTGFALLAAFYGQGSLPPRLARAGSRMAYTIAEPASPDCATPGVPTDGPCRCSCDLYFVDKLRRAVCRLDSGPVPDELTVGDCYLRIDDTRKVLNVTRPSRAN